MGRPFRFQPPALSVGTLARPRLLERVARRWQRRLVTIVAGPGFGKTLLLATAMRDTADDGHDVWLSCEPGDASGSALLAGLAEALGLDRMASFEATVDAIWVQAPTPVCLVLDNVHEIPAGSEGATTLERLLTDLPANGHLLLASREPVPVPTARIAVSGQLERICEEDMTFDPQEIETFATRRGVDASVLSSSGGWPAIAELTVTAGADLVFEYLWQELLERLGERRALGLARLVVAGGGDDAIAAALVPGTRRVADLVANVPLVERSPDGWVALHPLWSPALRRLLSDDEADEVRRTAAAVHCDAGRFGLAIDLLVESEAWDEVLAAIRQASLPAAGAAFDGPTFGRWYRLLPVDRRDRPEALFAAAIELQARVPIDAFALCDRAAEGFRARGDADGEIAVIYQDGVARWWANDLAGLLRLYERLLELAALGSPIAALVATVGDAAMGHVEGDSARTLAALANVDPRLAGPWMSTIHWFRHVAYRREGDLVRAQLELDAVTEPIPAMAPQRDLARLRMDWLAGRVDHVAAHLPKIEQHYRATDHRYLHTETALELAAKLAWLGELDAAEQLINEVEPFMAGTPGALAQILRLIAFAAVAVGREDEVAAAAILGADPLTSPGRPDNWYWRDRAALSLLHVLVPERREEWDREPIGPTHAIGLHLARALEAGRSDDLATLATLRWPAPGLARTHLPLRWLAELVAAGHAAGNSAPEALTASLGATMRPALRAVAASHPSSAVAAAATSVLARLPIVPAYRAMISVLGPLELRRDDVVVDHPDLRRQRVREMLCYLVAHRRVRRDTAGDALWPDVSDPRHNLRVTLNYVQRLLQPDRHRDETPFFIQTRGEWLELVASDHLDVDAWLLDARLDEAEHAARANDPAAALEAYRAVLPLWRGDAYVDVAGTPWGLVEQSRCRARYTAAALRFGELVLAKGAAAEALRAGELAISADPTCEPAYRLVARACLAADDPIGARHALEACTNALADLDARPDNTTEALLATIEGAGAARA